MKLFSSIKNLAALNDQVRGRSSRFVIAGAINTFIGITIYPVLLWTFPYFQKRYLVALGVCQATCLVIAFFIHRVGVFRSQGNILGEFLRFSSFYSMTYAANWIALPTLVEGAGLDPIIVQSGFTLVVLILSYFWHSRITFARREG